MKHEKMISRILCLLLIAAMMVNLVGCTQPQVPTVTDPTQTQAPTVQPTAPTTLPTTVPTFPSQPTTEPMPPEDANQLVFTLTQEDVDEFYRLLDEFEKLAIAGEDMEAIEASSDALDEMYEYLYAQNSIAMILYYYDMNAEGMKEQHLDTVEICTDASDAYTQSARRIYKSNTPARDMLFEGWTDRDIDMLMRYDEKIADLQQRNSEIEVAYREASSDTDRIPLYIEFVQNNNKIAKIYGYSNYYKYAYEIIYDRDYSDKEVKKMRKLAKESLTLSFDWANKKFNAAFQRLDSNEQKKVVAFLYNDYTTLPVDYVTRYLDAMPGNLKVDATQMLTVDSMFSKSGGSRNGAFTTTIGDRSYCFFGREYSSVTTVIHEAGHYYASKYMDLGDIPLDLAEVHSQGNEWLFMSVVGRTMKKTEFAALSNYMLYNNLAMILICLMVDEFEQKVYSTNISKYTAADFDALMTKVAEQYFDMSYINSNLTDVNSYWRAVVVEQPIYYISYAVSVIAAIDLYTVATEDFDAAAEIYRKLCEEPDPEAGFLGNITAAGLSTPFDDDFYSKLTALVKKN